MNIIDIRADYLAFLSESHLTEDQVRKMVEDMSDHLEIEHPGFVLADSPIEGCGMFAVERVEAFERIGYARLDGKRTIFGRCVNHSPKPNCEFRTVDGDLLMWSVSPIEAGEELTVDYRDSLKMTPVPALLDSIRSIEAARTVEQYILQFPQHLGEFTNLVHGGMCARTFVSPPDHIITGALVNLDNICIVYGDISVTTDEGTKRLTGFNVLPASRGHKRVGYTHSETHWTMIWRTDLTDLSDIEDELTDESNMLQTRRPSIEYADPRFLKGH